jgi:HPt (histidine-containing phosphotransfer) domain-containing protein
MKMFDDNASPYPELASVIDFNVLSTYVTEKIDKIEILKSFHVENRHDIASLNTALAQGDVDAASKAAHRMKGVCRMVGAHEMQNICYRIETATKQNDLKAAMESHGLLGDAMHRIEACIERFTRE